MLEDQPVSPPYEGDGCPNCYNGNEDGDINICDVEYDGDEGGVYMAIVWECERCGEQWSE